MIVAVGREIGALGIGCDLAGAVFLGVSLLKSPVTAASLLFDNPSFAGKRAVPALPIRDTVESMLQGRVGVALLVTGFLLQLISLLVPSRTNYDFWPLLAAVAAVLLARLVGNRWIRAHRASLFDDVIRAYRITEVIDDIDAARRSSRSTPLWKESCIVRALERFVDRA